MPANTTVEEQVALIRKYGCVHKAREAEFELSRERKAKDTTLDQSPEILGLNKNGLVQKQQATV